MRPRSNEFKSLNLLADLAAKSRASRSVLTSSSTLAATYLAINRKELFFILHARTKKIIELIEHYRCVLYRSNPLLAQRIMTRHRIRSVPPNQRSFSVMCFFPLEYAGKSLILAPKVDRNDFEQI